MYQPGIRQTTPNAPWALERRLPDICIRAVESAFRHLFTGALRRRGIRISMENKGRWGWGRANEAHVKSRIPGEAVVKRQKREDEYLKAYGNLGTAPASAGGHPPLYDSQGRHQSPCRHSPDGACHGPAVRYPGLRNMALPGLSNPWGQFR